MKSFIATVLAGCALALTAEKDVKLVVEVSRHGIRQPGPTQIFNLATDPSKEFSADRAYHLLEVGAVQHYALGTFVRERYGKILGETFQPEDTYVMSTGAQRTMESAKAQLAGIYAKHFRYPSVEDFPIVEVPHGENFLSHVDVHNCPRWAQLK